MLKNITLALLTLSAPAILQARICASTDNGNWNTAAIWSCGSVPVDGDTVIISTGHTVTVTSNLVYGGAAMHVEVHGTWLFDGNGSKITLPCGSAVIIYPTGLLTTLNANEQNSNSQTLRICNTTYWSHQDGPINGPMGWPLNVLPVEVLAFDASNGAQGVVLDWVTASESGSSHFELQRTADLLNWQVVGLVPAAGNSADIMTYSHVDADVARGFWFYRLVQVDQSGDRSGEVVVGIDVLGRSTPITCAPNPVSEPYITAQLNVPVSDGLYPIVRDLYTGRVLAVPAHNISGYRVSVTLPELANGVYLLQMTVEGEQRACRFIMHR